MTTILEQIQAWYTQATAAHPEIVKLYNEQQKLPRSYKLKDNDAWCAATITAAAQKLGLLDRIHPECSAHNMFMGMTERTNPQPGDLVFYDWNRNGVFDHVGIVLSVVGDIITAIEGNINGKMYKRTFSLAEYREKYLVRFCRQNEPEQPKAPAPAPADPNFYATVDELPEWAKLPISVMVQHGILQGDGKSLRIPKDETILRTWVMLGRVMLFCSTSPLTEGEA